MTTKVLESVEDRELYEVLIGGLDDRAQLEDLMQTEVLAQIVSARAAVSARPSRRS